ncbi:unnamed protein product, partial [Mesorhabditis belari]|uniref:Peptidase A2 domain-containing protein n=1 Tax=Mesorhabditis belari TaxID=2138241 RepID=A0AAF3EUB0_9BILA
MVLADDDPDIDEAWRHTANMLQARQQITNNAISKRKEQLNRWITSEMNGASTSRRDAKVQFHDEDIFLSACMSGDEDEVEELLDKGANINTATVDGLTALHQSVIDSKPEMVRFLCEKGADVNAQDNEGWTPLHAAACCGNAAIVQYLCQQGADLTIINSDKEVALDLAEDEGCREFLESEYKTRGIDPEKCRERELTTMMDDVQMWLREGHFGDLPHPRTGAMALHVAAAKGYTQLVELLLQAGADVNVMDKDGWTPLHAAAHWGERDSCKILIEHGASVTAGGAPGQSVLAVADKEIVEYLEDLEKTVVKRRIPSNPPPTILGEKNLRVDAPKEAAIILPEVRANHTHSIPHFHTTEQKHALVVKDEREENACLHSEAKHPRLNHDHDDQNDEDKNDTTLTEEQLNKEETPTPQTTANAYLPERMSIEKSLSGSSVAREAAGRERSMEISPDVVVRQSPFKSTLLQERNSISSEKELMPTNSSSFQVDQRMSTPSESITAVSTSATVPLRSIQQSSSWINRNVPLASSRTPSLSASPSPSISGSYCSEEASTSSAASGETRASSSSASRSASQISASSSQKISSSHASRSISRSVADSRSRSTTEESSEPSESIYSEEASEQASESSDEQPSTSTNASSVESKSESRGGSGGASIGEQRASSATSIDESLSSRVSSLTNGSMSVRMTFRQPAGRDTSSGGGTMTTTTPTTVMGGTVARSASTPSAALPWVRATSSGTSTPSAASVPPSIPPMATPITTSSSSSAFTTFLQKDRVSAFSAFRPPTKSTVPPAAPMSAPSLVSSSPLSPPSIRAPFRPQPLAAPVLRPWQATTPVATNESEAERRKEARMHRQARRSTQAVTKEQAEEASRSAAEEQSKRRSSRSGGEVRLASEERDTSEGENLNETPQNVSNSLSTLTTPSTSAILTLQSVAVVPPNNTPSAANIRKKTNQTATGGGLHTANRAVRRGTGPVLAEDVHAAVSLRCVAPTTMTSPQGGPPTTLPIASYTPMPGVTFQSGASSGFPIVRTTESSERHEKSFSLPPNNNNNKIELQSPVGSCVCGIWIDLVCGACMSILWTFGIVHRNVTAFGTNSF